MTRKASLPLAVSVSVVITIDVDAWRLAYGQDVTRQRIKDEVRLMVRDACGPEGGTFAPDAGIMRADFPRSAY